MDMAEGEVLDLRLDEEEFEEEAYFECIFRKTASLFAVSASIGAYAGGADDALAEKFSLFGKYLGTAYQIVDDLLEFLEVLEEKESKVTSETLPQIYASKMPREEAVERSLEEVKKYVRVAKEVLGTFGDCPAKDKLFLVTDYVTLDLLEKS